MKGINDLKSGVINIEWLDQNERDEFLKFLDNGTFSFFNNGKKNKWGFWYVEKDFYSLLKKNLNVKEGREKFQDWAFHSSIKKKESIKLGNEALEKYLAYMLFFGDSYLQSESNKKLNYTFSNPSLFLDILTRQIKQSDMTANSQSETIVLLKNRITELLVDLNEKLKDKTFVKWEIDSINSKLIFKKTELEGYDKFQENLKPTYDLLPRKEVHEGQPNKNSDEDKRQTATISQDFISSSQFTSQFILRKLINWILPLKYFVKTNLVQQDKRQLFTDLKLYEQAPYVSGKEEYENRVQLESKQEEQLDDLLFKLLNISYEKDISKDFKYFYITGPAGVGKSTIIQRILYLYRKRFFGKKKVFITPYKLISNEYVLKEANTSDLVLIDSLDESEDFTSNPEKALQNLLELLDKPQKILITCRSPYISSELIKTSHAKLGTGSAKRHVFFELLDFSQDNVKSYLTKRFKKNTTLLNKALDFFDFIDQKNYDFLARQWFLQHVVNNVDTLVINQTGEYKYQVLDDIVDSYIDRELNEKNFKGEKKDIILIYNEVCTNLAKQQYLNPSFTSFKLKELIPEKSDDENWIQVIKRSFLGCSESGEISFKHKVWYDLWLAKFLFTTKDYETECIFFNKEYWDKVYIGIKSDYNVVLDFWKEMVLHKFYFYSKELEISVYIDREKVTLSSDNLFEIDEIQGENLYEGAHLFFAKDLKHLKRIKIKWMHDFNITSLSAHKKLENLSVSADNIVGKGTLQCSRLKAVELKGSDFSGFDLQSTLSKLPELKDITINDQSVNLN